MLVVKDADSADSNYASGVYVITISCNIDTVISAGRITVTVSGGVPVVTFSATSYPQIAVYRFV